MSSRREAGEGQSSKIFIKLSDENRKSTSQVLSTHSHEQSLVTTDSGSHVGTYDKSSAFCACWPSLQPGTLSPLLYGCRYIQTIMAIAFVEDAVKTPNKAPLFDLERSHYSNHHIQPSENLFHLG